MSSNDLFGGPLAQAVGLALLHALWQGAIIAALTAAVLGLLSRRSAAWRYGVACAGLALVFIVAVGTAWRSYSPREVTAAPQVDALEPLPEDTVVITAGDPPPSWNDRWIAGLSVVRMHAPQILVFWLTGVLILSIRLTLSWTRARNLAFDGAAEPDPSWQRIASRLGLAFGLRDSVRLVVSRRVDVPSVVGWIKPVVLLPVSSFSGLTTEQLEMVLAHELAHIRRHDFLINAMQSVVETLLFYHPAVWWLSRQIRIERENCCDDLAVSVCGDPLAYARTLTQLEELRGLPSPAVSANGGSLMERIRRLVASQSERTLFSSGWTAAAAITSFAVLLALATAPTFAERSKKPAQTPAPAAPAPTPAPAAPAPTPAPPAKPARTHVEVRAPLPPVADVSPAMAAAAAAAAAQMTYVDLPDIDIDVEIDTPEPDGQETPSTTPPGKLSVDDLIALRIQNVTPEYVEQMRALFGGEMRIRDIIALRIQGLTRDYVSDMRAAGVPIKTAGEAIALKIQGVKPDFVRQLAAAGYDHLSVRDLVRLAVSGVNADFIREMSKYNKK